MKKQKTIKLTDDKALELYKTAEGVFKVLLEENWGIEFFNQDITNKIKTMKDVLDYLNIDRLEDVLPYNKPKDKFETSINGFVKIKLIAKVLNEGWVEDFNDYDQYKYYPWFEKRAFGWSVVSVFFYYASTGIGSGCFYKSRKLAEHVSDTFLEEYKEYLPL